MIYNGKIYLINAIAMKKLLIILNLMLSTGLISYAQSGAIAGKVIDEKTGEELIGATIVITGTTTGTITDFEGNYLLENLAPGIYRISVSFVSYQTQEFTEVEVIAGNVTTINVNLGEAVTALEEVKVVARSQQRTEAALQMLQKKSATVMDGISSEQISRLGDSDAAGALKRVTGVSVQGGKYVYVRGLSDRFMKITLNNAEIPGLDPNYNTVQMDLFPSNIIESMTVAKTYTPDKPSFTSGLVNIKTKDFPSTFTLSASAKIEFNTNVHGHSNFLKYEGGSSDWLAYDDGTRSLPDDLTGIEIPNPTNEENVPVVNAYSRSFNKIMSPEHGSAPLNSSYSFSFGDQLKLKGTSSLGYIAAVSYKSSHAYHDDGRLDLYNATTANVAAPDELLAEEKGVNSVIWSGLAGVNYKITNNHKIGYTFMRTQNGESTARFMRGHTYYSDDFDMEKFSLEYLYRTLTVNQVSGVHVFPRLNNAKVEWFSSYTKSVQNVPDLRFFINEVVRSDEDTTYFVRSNRKPERRYRDMNESNWDNNIDFSIPVNSVLKFQVGGAYLRKIRNSNENRFTVNQRSSVDNYNGNPSDYVADSNLVTGSYDSDDNYRMRGIYYSNDFFENTRLSYYGEDIISGVYAMADLLLFEKLRIITGVRMEKGTMFIENNVDTTDMDLRPSQRRMYSSGESKDQDFLPTLNLKYELVPNMNLRFGYSKSITRPSFRERAPYTFYEYTEGTNIEGNPELKRGLVDNYDFRWEYFFKPGEMVSFSLFYKKIYSPIERYELQSNVKLTQFRNGYDADLYGVEIEFRKRLDFVHVIRNISVGANASYIFTETPVDSSRLAQAREIVPDFPETRPLYGQSPYIVNAFLNYTHEELGLYANVAFNIEGPKIIIISKRFTPDVYEQPYPQLNLNIGKTFFENFTLEFAAENLLNPTFQQNITMQDGSVYPFRKYSEGRSFSLSLTYSIR